MDHEAPTGLRRGYTVLLCLPLAASGCARPLRPIFEQQRPAMIWPAPPTEAPARIRYVGQLASSADLKPPEKPFQALGDLFVGAKEPEQLYGPRAVVCTNDGQRVWVADAGGRCLHVFDLERREYTKIERAGGEHLLSPVGLCMGPADSVFVCDSEAVAVYRYSADTGSFVESLRLREDVIRPAAISYSAADGELYLVDVSAHDIKVLELDGSLRRLLGRRGREAGEFNFPCDIVLDGDLIWVVDAGNHRVQGLTKTGEAVFALGQAGDAMGDLALPKAVALDSDGHIYVVDARFENVQVFDREGALLLVFGQEGIGPGEFWLPAGIFVDDNDRIWICDSYNRRVQVFDYLKPAGQTESGLQEDTPVIESTPTRVPAPGMEVRP